MSKIEDPGRALHPLLHERLDHQLRHVSPRRKLRDGDYDRAEVFDLQHLGFALVADRGRPVLQDRRVHFPRIDVGDPNAVGRLFVPGGNAEGGAGELRGVVGNAAEG